MYTFMLVAHLPFIEKSFEMGWMDHGGAPSVDVVLLKRSHFPTCVDQNIGNKDPTQMRSEQKMRSHNAGPSVLQVHPPLASHHWR